MRQSPTVFVDAVVAGISYSILLLHTFRPGNESIKDDFAECKIWSAIQGSMSDHRLTDTKQWLRKRRSQRIEWTVPVVVHRAPKEGPQFYERAQTLVVNAHGALVALAEKVTAEQRLLMQNIDSGEQKECRVVYVEKERTGPTKVAVEFAQPAPTFWRIAYPPDDWTAGA